MRRLIVMRHAKSSWESSTPTDHARPLNPRGREDAPRVGAALVERGWVPDLVLSSDAKRTRETFAAMSEVFPGAVEARYLPSFYHDGPGAVQDELPGIPDWAGCLLLLGHNPGWESLVRLLSGEAVVMKTATAVLLSAGQEKWSAGINPGGWTLEEVIYPRDL